MHATTQEENRAGTPPEDEMQAKVRRLELSADALKALNPQRRYVFALVGHISNELLLLQKWVHISPRASGNPGPQDEAAVSVTMFLVRLLSAKAYERFTTGPLARSPSPTLCGRTNSVTGSSCASFFPRGRAIGEECMNAARETQVLITGPIRKSWSHLAVTGGVVLIAC